MGADTDEEGVDPVGSLPRPVPHVVAGGHDLKGGGSNADGGQVHSTDRLSRTDKPDPVPNNQVGRTGVDRGEVNSPPHPDLEVVRRVRVQGDTDKEEGEEFYSCSSDPSTPRSRESNGA